MLQVVMGFPGSGKTTFCAKLAYKAQKKGIKVYSNIPELTSTIPVELSDFGKFQIHNGLVLLDESGIFMSNRNWKGFPHAALQFFKLHRHYGCDVWVFSQAKDFDKVVRDLAERQYILQKSRLPWWSSLTKLVPHWEIDQVTGDCRSAWSFVPWYGGGVKWTYRPRWYKYFDSWSAPVLPPLPAELEWQGSQLDVRPLAAK